MAQVRHLITESAMRSRRPLLAVSLLGLSIVACTAPSGDDAEEQTANVTGGSSRVTSPTVFLIEEGAAVRDAAPKCMGAMLGDKIAITLKSCAKEGMTLARANRRDTAKVKKVHVPQEADAEIAIVELDKALEGTHARLTHMPLRAGYAVNAVASIDGRGLFAPDEGDASQIDGSMLQEDALYGAITPNRGTEICAGDIGAPVCSTTGTTLFGYTIVGTCGLSGLVTGPMEAPATPPSAADKGCSAKPWKVAQLGRYVDFVKRYAPGAFEPLRIDKPVLRNIKYVPDGLWGYRTGGKVKSCKIDTSALVAIQPGTSTTNITALVSFAEMENRAAPWGRFGIAPKGDPTKTVWYPAKMSSSMRGPTFDAKFEGILTPAKEGEYVVTFRASPNGGESWIECDTDGIDNGFEIAKGLSLKVGSTETPPATPPPVTPQDTPPASSEEGGGFSDPPPSSPTDSEDGNPPPGTTEEEDDGTFAKKRSSDSGCSTSGTTPASSGLPLLGVLLGLAALSRRRR